MSIDTPACLASGGTVSAALLVCPPYGTVTVDFPFAGTPVTGKNRAHLLAGEAYSGEITFDAPATGKVALIQTDPALSVPYAAWRDMAYPPHHGCIVINPDAFLQGVAESVTVGGVRLNLLDTAGLRQTEDVVESIGVERAYAAADKADAVVYVLDGDQEPDPQLLARVEGKHLFVVRNKSDLGTQKRDYPTVSAKLGLGIDSLLADLAALVNTTHAVGGMLVEDRHVQAVSRALAHLRTAREAYETMPLDAVALSLRQAYSALGEIDGATATDQIIDGIFSRFCVGK